MKKPLILAVTAATIALGSGFAFAQTVADDSVPTTSLNIPGDVKLFGDAGPNVYRPSATVNGEIITATDIEHRLALVRVANNNVDIPPEEVERLRQQIFMNLIDEKLQIQEAKANDIDIEDALVEGQFGRIAAQYKRTPDKFSEYLASKGSSSAAIKQQIRGEIAWERLLQRNVESTTNVSGEEVQAIIDRLKLAKGTEEFHVGEIYLSATPENAEAIFANAQRIMEQLQRGGSFPAYARQFSEASTAVVGGDLGFVRAGQLPSSMTSAVTTMQPGQLVGPVEVPGGFSIIYLIDKRQVLTADPRDAILSLKQIALEFSPGTSEAKATELAGKFADETRKIAGCGMADSVAAKLGATIVARDQIELRSLPPQLQTTLIALQIGQTTQPFGSRSEGVSVLVLCGRDLPTEAALPSKDVIEGRLREEKVNKRAQRYLRDLRRDAVIEYS